MVILGLILLASISAVAYILARMAVWGWRYTQKMPGGLEVALAHPWTTRGEIVPECVLIYDHEHYRYVHLSPMWATVALTNGKFISISRFSPAYRTIQARMAAIPTWGELKVRLERERGYL